MLRDASGLCGDDLALPQAVQQRRLTVVHVTHDGDHRGPWHQEGGISRRSVKVVGNGEPYFVTNHCDELHTRDQRLLVTSCRRPCWVALCSRSVWPI